LLRVGLTGGIASGKSAVGEMFVGLGAHLIQADRIAHDLMAPGQAVYDEVVRRFGRGILNADLTLNRARLAEAAFGGGSNPDLGESSGASQGGPRVSELNRIVHPAVLRAQVAWMDEMGRQDTQGVAMVEAALILEAGAAKDFDRLIVVTCSEEQRVARFAARQKIAIEDARKEVARRMAAQLPDEEKIKVADYVIDNSGALERTGEQVLEIWPKLRG
jgi:dephospho-CoA kinase